MEMEELVKELNTISEALSSTRRLLERVEEDVANAVEELIGHIDELSGLKDEIESEEDGEEEGEEEGDA